MFYLYFKQIFYSLPGKIFLPGRNGDSSACIRDIWNSETNKYLYFIKQRYCFVQKLYQSQYFYFCLLLLIISPLDLVNYRIVVGHPIIE